MNNSKHNPKKERITILISSYEKKKLLDYSKENNFKNLSDFIRSCIDFYMEYSSKIYYLENFPPILNEFKDSLTVIKGYSQIIIEKHTSEIPEQILLKIKDIYLHSIDLQNKINTFIEEFEELNQDFSYHIVIIDNNIKTFEILKYFFLENGYKSKLIRSGDRALKHINKNPPRLVLLNADLPDLSAYEIVKKIKLESALNKIPIYYYTNTSDLEILNKIKETKANGYFLKPFDFSKMKVLFKHL
ncbi:MAG: response regulator [Promethearchaeia archaeon]